jgi:threonine dehydrogenase-like Zn-dependent dehydrogenase
LIDIKFCINIVKINNIHALISTALEPIRNGTVLVVVNNCNICGTDAKNRNKNNKNFEYE